MTDIARLVEIIRELHGCTARHVRSEPVTEKHGEHTIWEGVVEVFHVSGDARTSTAYAWRYVEDDGTVKYVAVLGVPPIRSAADAVRAAVVAKAKAMKDSGG